MVQQYSYKDKENKVLKIGVDLRPFYTGSKYRGIGMYARELLKEMLELDKEDEFHMLSLYGTYEGDPELNERCFFYQYFAGPKKIDVGERQLLYDPRTVEMIEAEVKNYIRSSKIDIMFFTSPNEYGNLMRAEWFKGIFKVGILYDLIPLIFPKQCLFDSAYRADYEKSIEFIKEMDLLLAISQATKDDAVKKLGISANKIVVIHAGIDTEFRKLDLVNVKALKNRYRIENPFILFAGGIDFKKNVEGLIEAYALTNRNVVNNYQLVITGKADQQLLNKFLSIAEQNGVGGRVVCTGFVPKKDLIELYNTTEALVFPSLYEGFGLPVLEAMACGTSVVTANSSSLKEIAEGHAILVNPKSTKSITKGIERVFEDPAESKNRAEENIEYAKSYTWEKVAYKTLDAIRGNYKEGVKDSYEFEISEELLKNIAYIYAENNFSFNKAEKELIADDLLLVARHANKIPLHFKHRILYDFTVVSEWMKANYRTGIGRVSSQLFMALSRKEYVIPVVWEYIKGEGYVLRKVSVENWNLGEMVELKKSDVYFMPELQLRGIQIERNHPYAQELREKGIKCYAIIFDILPLLMPQYFEKKTSENFDGYIKEIVSNYDGVLGISKDVVDTVLDYCNRKKIKAKNRTIKIGYFHLGQDTFEMENGGHVSAEIRSFLEKDLDSDTFFMLGTIEPRKGYEIVLSEFERKWEKGDEDRLCIVGHVGWNMQRFVDKLKQHPENGQRLAFFEAISDAEVAYIYGHVSALIQASAGEGFGLPLIEAGYYQVPIICSDIAVFHEVAEDHVIYFDRNQEGSLEEAIIRFKELELTGSVPKSEEIKVTTWNDSADKVIGMILQDDKWYSEIR